jgi:hypothetical protein
MLACCGISLQGHRCDLVRLDVLAQREKGFRKQ